MKKEFEDRWLYFSWNLTHNLAADNSTLWWINYKKKTPCRPLQLRTPDNFANRFTRVVLFGHILWLAENRGNKENMKNGKKCIEMISWKVSPEGQGGLSQLNSPQFIVNCFPRLSALIWISPLAPLCRDYLRHLSKK